MPRGAWKKFWLLCWKHKVQECCLQSLCLLCRVEEQCNMKYPSLCKDTGYIIVFVPIGVPTVFVGGIKYIDLPNLQRGVLETFVTASDVHCLSPFNRFESIN